MELNENTTLTNLKEEVWVRIPGSMIKNIQLEDGMNFIEKYGNYDQYEFEIVVKEGDDEE